MGAIASWPLATTLLSSDRHFYRCPGGILGALTNVYGIFFVITSTILDRF